MFALGIDGWVAALLAPGPVARLFCVSVYEQRLSCGFHNLPSQEDGPTSPRASLPAVGFILFSKSSQAPESQTVIALCAGRPRASAQTLPLCPLSSGPQLALCCLF